MLKIILTATVLAVSTFAGAGDPVPAGCMSGMARALVAGGFSGGVICSRENASFDLAGTTRWGYAVYDYRYRFLPEHGAVVHGGQRMVVFRDGRYIGQYSLSPPPLSRLSVRGSRVLVRVDGSGAAALDFSDGPPPQIFVDGSVLDLYR
jgi:hypothetical protein